LTQSPVKRRLARAELRLSCFDVEGKAFKSAAMARPLHRIDRPSRLKAKRVYRTFLDLRLNLSCQSTRRAYRFSEFFLQISDLVRRFMSMQVLLP